MSLQSVAVFLKVKRRYIYLFKKSVGVFGVLGPAVSDPLSEPLLRRFGDAPRANFTEKMPLFCLAPGLVFGRFWPPNLKDFGGARRSEKEREGAREAFRPLAALRALLVPSWSHLGTVLGHLGTFLGHLGPSCGCLGAVLGRLGDHLGPV